jgi:hypothetical protein
LLSGEILGFSPLEDEPHYKVRRPNKGGVSYFLDFGIANSCFDVVYIGIQKLPVFSTHWKEYCLNVHPTRRVLSVLAKCNGGRAGAYLDGFLL